MQGKVKKTTITGKEHEFFVTFTMTKKRSSAYEKVNDDKFELKVVTRDTKSAKVIGVQCRFCITFGREEKADAKRKVASSVQAWQSPFRYDNIEHHLCTQHTKQWDVYQTLETSLDRKSFFDDGSIAFKNSLKVHFPSSLEDEGDIVYEIERDIVDTVVDDMMFNLEDAEESDEEDDEEDVHLFGSMGENNTQLSQRRETVIKSKARALSLFHRVKLKDADGDYFYLVTIPKTKTMLFRLAMRYVSCGTSFRMASELVGCAYDVLGNLALRACSRHDISEVVFTMVSKFLTVLCPDWTNRLLGLTTDGARNVTGRITGAIVTRLADVMDKDCPFIRIWCEAHQLDLIMEEVMNNVIKERFFAVMTRFITHLTRQQN
ncbi:hypothetical protein AXG93_1913s1070 [Marchantia polymorpha subsp. ruderalis]|uniref:DUF4371 domain-containing protein n=1 Tax=Marchantia polymorpha subsp. ruderalis TaxID=1480154 RepID=A0A176WL97_MARPO|nr:hypothetical protein AXG93_1913s1070 [Marchantia polymorpha subsp. ruderalis]